MTKYKKKKKKRKYVPKKYDFIIIDTEFTEHNELLEVAIVKRDGSTLYHRYFKPYASSWRTDVHGITPKQVADAPNARDCKDDIINIIKQADILVFFDPHRDRIAFHRSGVHLADNVWDVQQMYKQIFRKQESLSTIVERMGAPQEREHNALSDARCIAHLFNVYLGFNDMLLRMEYDPQFWY